MKLTSVLTPPECRKRSTRCPVRCLGSRRPLPGFDAEGCSLSADGFSRLRFGTIGHQRFSAGCIVAGIAALGINAKHKVE